MRLIVGVSGASGVVMSYYLLQALRAYPEIETHLVMTEGAKVNFSYETSIATQKVLELADVVHNNQNLAASISSGSFQTDGMIVMPCSMKSLAGIACGYADNLLLRAADVCLKEGRKVVLVPREMPLSRIHLRNLQSAAEAGCAIIPPMLTFYNGADHLEEQIKHVVGKVLMQFGLTYKDFKPWQGESKKEEVL